MDRQKAQKNKNLAKRLIQAWNVPASHGLFREIGNWYQPLKRFPSALFDRYGYVRFETEAEYRSSPYLLIGKQIGFKNGGCISEMPEYVRVSDAYELYGATAVLLKCNDVDVHSLEATEGIRRLVLHLRRERNQTIVRKKKDLAKSFECEICGFSFARVYGADAKEYCEVHHLAPLSDVEDTTKTRMKDLAIVCANCHRVIHLRNPPYQLIDVKNMLLRAMRIGDAHET